MRVIFTVGLARFSCKSRFSYIFIIINNTTTPQDGTIRFSFFRVNDRAEAFRPEGRGHPIEPRTHKSISVTGRVSCGHVLAITIQYIGASTSGKSADRSIGV